MTDAWFSDVPRWFAFFSLLSILAWPASEGRFKTAITGIWIVMTVSGGILLGAAVLALVLGQPFHVVKALSILGAVFTVAFGATFPALRNSYREAELRKTIAADL